jgi:hypothetical protein
MRASTHRHRRRYSRGESERSSARRRGRPRGVVLATKFHGTMGETLTGATATLDHARGRRALRRLKTEWIDLPGASLGPVEQARGDALGAVGSHRAGRSATSDPRRTRCAASRHNGSRANAGCRDSCASSRRTRCWCAGSRPMCCRRAWGTRRSRESARRRLAFGRWRGRRGLTRAGRR